MNKDKLITIYEKNAIDNRLRELEVLAKRFGAEIGEATNAGAETWHDNASYDAAKERLMHVDKEKYQLRNILHSNKIVDPVQKINKVQVGAEVTFTNLDDGEQNTYKIGGEATRLLGEGWLNYQTPIAQMLLGKKATQTAKGVINNQPKAFKIDAVDIISQ